MSEYFRKIGIDTNDINLTSSLQEVNSSTDNDYETNIFSEENINEENTISFDSSTLDKEEWSSVEAKENKFLGISKGTYTFTTSSGVKITVEDVSDIEIYENKDTGEVIVVNANGATITSGSKDAKISVYDSIIDKIDTSKGNDEVNIYNSEVNKIDTGRGIDYINIENSDVDDVLTGSGNDTVNIFNSTIANTNTSSNTLWGLFDDSEDTVIINDTQIGKVKTGKGEDNIIANNSTIEVLNTGFGSDSVNINQTEVGKNKGNKKDTVIEDSNYLDVDLQEIANINSNAQIQIDEETTITVNDYVNYLLEQEVGFETEEEYQEYVLQTLTNNLESIKSTFLTQEDSEGVVSDGYNLVKEFTGLGITDEDIQSLISEQEAMIEGLNLAINGESEMSFEQAYEYYTGTTYSQEKIDKYLEVSNIYSAVMVGCQYDEDYMDKLEESTGKSVDDISKEFALCQLDTFGRSTGLQDLVEKYSNDQENFANKLSGAISACGMTCIVTGAVVSFVFPPAAAVGMGLMSAGKGIALSGMYIDNAMDLVDNATDSDGLTKNEISDLVLETGVETVSYVAGRGIGKLTNGLNSTVTSKLTEQGVGNVTSYIAGQAVETVTDTALSLGADYAIAQGQSLITTGEFMNSEDYWSLDRFLGEGRSQLIGILTGLSSAKVSAYQQGVIKIAQEKIIEGDIEGAKTCLSDSGIEITDTDFDGFIKCVEEIETQVKTPEEIRKQKIKELRDSGIDSYTASKIADLNDEQYSKYETLTNEGVDIENALNRAKLDETQCEKYLSLIDKGFEPKNAVNMAILDEVQCEKYKASIEQGIDSYWAFETVKLEDTQYLKCTTLLEQGVNSSTALEAAKLSDEQYERFKTIIENGENSYTALEVAKLDDLQYSRYTNLINKNVDSYSATKVAILDEVKYTRVETLFDMGIEIYNAQKVAILEDSQYSKCTSLLDKGIDLNTAIVASKLDDIAFSKYETIVNKGIGTYWAMEATKLDEIDFQKCVNLLEKEVLIDNALEVIKLEDRQYSNFETLIDRGINKNIALDAIKLADKQYSKFETLINNDVSDENAYTLACVIQDDYSSLLLKEKCSALVTLKQLKLSLSDEEIKKTNIDFDNEIGKVQSSIEHVITTSDVPKAQITQMMKGFFANNNAELENTLSTTDFTKYGKDGLPLTYSRVEFLNDLSYELTKLPAETQTEIINKLGIEVIQDESGNITGYNGVIDLTKLSSDGREGEILSLATKFIEGNSVSTGDSELDTALNSLIQGMPEFINVIGKQQHETHNLSIDSHILTVLQNVMSDTEYENLSDTDKFCLKFATVLHDIAKAEGVVDEGHAEISALYARDILNRTSFNLPSETKNRIFEMIKNHHWLATYNTGNTSAEDVSAMFRKTDDLTSARILARADLKGVSEEFYEQHKLALSSDKQNPITESLNKINSTGQMFLTNSVIDKSKVPTIEYNGKTYKMINFSELSSDTDLQQYGFEPDTTVDNFRILVHTVKENSIIDNLENVLLLGESANQGLLCASYISIDNKNTYWNNKFGVALSSRNENIANASSYNQRSGYEKGFERFTNIITEKDEVSEYRKQVTNAIKETLCLTDDEYSELYSNIQKYKYAYQLENIPSIAVGNKTYTGTQIKDAIMSADDSIINPDSHNELNVYAPQTNAVIAKVNSIEEVPQELLDFAEKHNLPIYLLGSD